MRILVDENIPLGKEAFAAHGETVSFAGRGLSRGDMAAADALIVRSVTRVDAGLLEGTPVRFVGTATIGTDHVDQEYLRARGIGFSSAPGCNSHSVGDYVAAALTHLEYRKSFSLVGRTLGLVGYGHVGKQVARRAAALGLRVLKCDPPLRDASGSPGEFSDLGALLVESDIVSLHVPLVRNGPYPTLGLAGKDFFARLSRPIVLINTCRGDVVREPDLLAALDAGRIRHLVLDVFDGEPRIDQGLCARADLITPHVAGYSLLGKLNGTAQIAEAFRRFFGFGDRWVPEPPGPARPIIDYAGFPAASDTAFSHHCVAAAYDILADDARLRQSFREADPGKAFDRQRRDYPIRHEFPAFRILGLPHDKGELRSRLLGLGFQVE
jgi:erythronate-4-phosphate dehydrogenase